jgi:NOL1/NOP2/sun family putative RNA methylase
MNLPPEYLAQMEKLLGKEHLEFQESLREKSFSGLRVNTLKIDIAAFLDGSPFKLEPVPWAQEGFYYDDRDRPAKHSFYHAGLYYLQEPSAMAPVALLDPKPGEKVLDLCAAPGGKTTQIGARIKGQGILVANDVSKERTKPLVKNLELFGVRNCLITNEDPEKLAGAFAGFFDKILIDAPCSGEGMFRKDISVVKSWQKFRQVYPEMQEHILEQAARMLRPGGLMLYSTCTFNPEENEGQIKRFLENNIAFTVELTASTPGMAGGRPDWVGGGEELKKTVRLWPHLVKGEGHFAALLKKQVSPGESAAVGKGSLNYRKDTVKGAEGLVKNAREVLEQFWAKYLKIPLPVNLVSFNNYIYSQPEDLPPLAGVKIVRAGWFLGEIKKDRFEPSQALAMGLKGCDFVQLINLPEESPVIDRYLKGETLANETGHEGWVGICINNHPLGWSKGQGSLLKNYYLKGWRKT